MIRLRPLRSAVRNPAPLALQPLEPRLLLSAVPPHEPHAALVITCDPAGTVTYDSRDGQWVTATTDVLQGPAAHAPYTAAEIDALGAGLMYWRGEHVYARRDAWIVQFTDLSGPDAEARALQRLQSDALAAAGLAVTGVESIGLDGLFVAQTSAGYMSMVRALSGVEGSGFVQPDLMYWVDATRPNDPSYGSLWGMEKIDAPEAWDTTTGGANGIVVAVIDTGVNYTHPDLAGNMWRNPGEIPGNGVDDDGNGYVDDVYGIDAYNNDSDPRDDHFHGSHCSGTIGGVGNNGIGVAGVNWDVQIMALKFLGGGGSGWTSGATKCVNYMITMARDYGVNVRLSSNSWGGGGYDSALYTAIQASGSQNQLFVAAAGNDASSVGSYPAYYNLPNIISVAATDSNDSLAYFSNWGTGWVDLAAPGVSVYSTSLGTGYSTASGTSMACPHVSGAAALLWDVNPVAGWSAVKQAILTGVDPVATLASKVGTGGRLNVNGALQAFGYNVVGSSPAAGEVVLSPRKDFTVHFGTPYRASTVQAADFVVNGAAANSFTLLDPDTITFHYLASPLGLAGTKTMSIAADAIVRDSDGRGLSAWNAAFQYQPSLIVDIPADATEGDGTLQGRVSLPAALEADLVVSLTSSDTTEVTVQPSVTIAAGTLEAPFSLQVVDDTELDWIVPLAILASAPGDFRGENAIRIHDNETTSLTVTLPPAATEGDGHLPAAGTVTAAQAPTRDVRIDLFSHSPTELTVPGSVLLRAGETRVSFDLTIVNDAVIDGTQSAAVEARVESWSFGTATMLVHDDDSTLHAFRWGPVETREIDVPFPATLTAINVHGDHIPTYAGTVSLRGLAGGTAFTVAPPALDLVGGQWTGEVTVSQQQLSMRLLADDGQGHTGQSDLFAVLGPSPAPTSIDLLPASDTGTYNDDDLTRNNNSNWARTLSFAVTGTAVGAVVAVYADGTYLGQTTALDSTTIVTTNGALPLSDGTWAFTARQTVPGGLLSPASPALDVRIDGTGPRVTAFGMSSESPTWTLGRLDSATLAARPNVTLPWPSVNRMLFDFDEPVTGSAIDCDLHGNLAGSRKASRVSGTQTTHLVWTFSGQTPDDAWTLELADEVVDLAGNPLDGEPGAYPSGNGSPGGHWFFNFRMLAGDSNADGQIGPEDASALRAAYGARSGEARYDLFADLDGSGRVDISDRGVLRAHRTGSVGDPAEIDDLFAHLGSADAWYDYDGDGDVDFADVEYLVRVVFGTEFGDTNLDQRVDLDDLTQLGSAYGAAGAYSWAQGDFNGDGAVGLEDLTLLGSYYGFGTGES